MRSKYAVKSKIVVSALIGLSLFVLGACSYNTDSSSKETSIPKAEETANNEITEQTKTDNESNDVVVEQEINDESTEVNDSATVDNTEQSADIAQTELGKTPEELYFEQVKHDTEWQMMPRDECKTVTLEDRTLRLEIYLTRNDKLLERYKDISDAILAIESGYDWWDTLVIDFGSLGLVTKTKEELVDGHFEVTKDDFIKN